MDDKYSRKQRMEALYNVLKNKGGWMTNDELLSALPWITHHQVTQYLNTLMTEGRIISRERCDNNNYFEYSVNMMYSAGSVINQLWRK